MILFGYFTLKYQLSGHVTMNEIWQNLCEYQCQKEEDNKHGNFKLVILALSCQNLGGEGGNSLVRTASPELVHELGIFHM